MTHLDIIEKSMLRAALGLSYYSRINPTRNFLSTSVADKEIDTVHRLVDRGFLVQDKVHGQGGIEWFYKATDAGRVAVLDQPWE